MVPPNRKGFVLLDGLTRPGDTELGPNGRTLVVAESDAKIEKFVFGVSGQVKDTDGNLLVGATITGTTPISGTPGTGDTVSQRRTDAGGWFHLFNLLTPPTGSDTVDALITIEYQGKSQAYEVKLGPDGQKVQDFTFGATRLTLNVSGEGTVTPPAGVHDYLRNASVTLQATPAEGWRFMRWTGDLESAQNPLDIVMSSDTVVTAVFDRP
jgi:hypothetical protein